MGLKGLSGDVVRTGHDYVTVGLKGLARHVVETSHDFTTQAWGYSTSSVAGRKGRARGCS